MCEQSTIAMLGNVATGLQIGGAVAGAYGKYEASKGEKAAYEYKAAVERNNAQLAEWQAKDAITRGQMEEQRQRLKTAALKGTQRASLAASGVSLAEGSPLSILEDTEFMGELDARTISENAGLEAWGYRQKARGYASDAAMLSARAETESPFAAAATSLITDAGTVASSWYTRKATAAQKTVAKGAST